MDSKKLVDSFSLDFLINTLSILYPKDSELSLKKEKLLLLKNDIDKINANRERLSKIVLDIDKCIEIVDRMNMDLQVQEILKFLLNVLKYRLKDSIHDSRPSELLYKKYLLQKEIDLEESLKKAIDAIFERIV